MSNFKVEIVPVVLEPHPQADTLSIVKVYNYTVCVRTADWQDKTIGAYIPPESAVPNDERFAFLQGKTRIKVKRLRGVISMGLLIPAPDGAQLGDDVADVLGVTHYEPPLPLAKSGGEVESPPPGLIIPKYDIEHLLRYGSLFNEGEMVYVTEKIHGANARFLWHENRMWCGSKNEWKKYWDESLWWTALKQNPWIEDYCREHPGDVVYAEIFGNVQSLKYGAKSGHYFVRVFDILRDKTWLPPEQLFAIKEIKCVPLIGIYPFNLEAIQAMAEGLSLIENADHIREGVVVRPTIERYTNEIGRLQLKLISNAYLSQ